jgi:acetyl-CoA synthetase (ADP-forming)
MSLKQQLDYLFDARSVAVIGASNDMIKWGFNILNILLSKGGRPVYAVNRKGEEVQGQQAYRSIGEVPGPVDVAVLTVPFQYLPATMQECVSKGVKAAVIISGGLAETGEEGKRVERETIEVARRAGIRVIGPNCMGHFNAYANLFTVPYLPPVRPGPLSLISQSGNTSQSIVYLGYEAGIGFSKYVSSGNEADLHFEDYLEYFAADENTKIVAGYIEGLREGRRFFELAKEITKKKPVVVMKAGATEAGARAAQSHTASLAGSDLIAEAALKQCGVIRVEQVVELVDVCQALLSQPLPRGRRVGVLSTGGGGAVMAGDALMRQGLELPQLSPATVERLNTVYSRRWSHGNPIDNGGDPFDYAALWALLDDENVDSVVIIGAAGTARNMASWVSVPDSMRQVVEEWIDTSEVGELADVKKLFEVMWKLKKPALFCNLAIPTQRRGRLCEDLKERCDVPFRTPERTARVLRHLVDYSTYLGVAGGG